MRKYIIVSKILSDSLIETLVSILRALRDHKGIKTFETSFIELEFKYAWEIEVLDNVSDELLRCTGSVIPYDYVSDLSTADDEYAKRFFAEMRSTDAHTGIRTGFTIIDDDLVLQPACYRYLPTKMWMCYCLLRSSKEIAECARGSFSPYMIRLYKGDFECVDIDTVNLQRLCAIYGIFYKRKSVRVTNGAIIGKQGEEWEPKDDVGAFSAELHNGASRWALQFLFRINDT